MAGVPTQPRRDAVMDDLIDALRVFTVETDVFVDVFARAHGLGRNDLNAIMWISTGGSSGQPITIGELANRLGLSAAATTALVDRLEATGHVSRARDATDRRRVTVAMQETALRVASAFFVPLGRRMTQAAETFTNDELVRTTAIIRSLTAAVTSSREETAAPPTSDG
jgi:DNA-binding MarR family transcriptional regulator